MGNPNINSNRRQAYLEGQALVDYIAKDTGCNPKPNADGQYTGGSCPVHGHKGNFSVALGDNGMPVVKCFKNCPSDEIVEHYKRRGVWPSGTGYQRSTPQEDFAQFATGTDRGNRSGGTTDGAKTKNPTAKANAKRAFQKLLEERAKQERLDAAKEAWRISHDCDPNNIPDEHPYNIKRGGRWTGGDARRGYWPHNGEDLDALILPFCDTEGKTWTLQAIGSKELKAGNGTARKVFMKGGLSRGSFYSFTPTADPNIKTFLIAEGFFTAQAACHCFLHHIPEDDERGATSCFIVAGSVNNLALVAYQLKTAHPGADIIILADEGSAEAAEESARTVDGKVARPAAGLPEGAEQKHGYDFWDLHKEHGAAAVIKAIEAATEPPPEEEPELLKDTAEAADREQNQERPFEERQAEYKARFGQGRTEAFRRHLAEAANRQKIPTGIEALDNMLGGGLRPGLYMIQAMPSAGKTSLSYQIADNIAAGGQDVLFYSLEMGEEEITAKSYSRITWERSGHNIRQAKSGLQLLDPEFYQHASAEDLAIAENAIRQYEDTSGQHLIVMTDNDARTKPSDIANDIENHIAYTGNTPLVFIDYFQLLHPPLANGTDKQNADMNIVALKQLCRKYKIPIWAISSMNRGGYENPFGMASMKESGNLEFAGDVIMGLAFTDKNGNPTHKEQSQMEIDEATAYRVGLHIIKGRLIKTGPMKPGLVFFGAYNSFEPYDKRQDGKDDATIYEAAMDTLIFQLEEPHRQTGLSPRQITRPDGDTKHRAVRAAILKTGIKVASLEGLIKDAIERGRAYIEYGEGDGNNRPEILRATSTRKAPKATRKDDGKDAKGGLFK